MRPFNSRKGQTSITHLMNFSLPPRPQNNYHHSHGHGRNYRRNPTWGLGSGYHAIDKARYVHPYILVATMGWACSWESSLEGL